MSVAESVADFRFYVFRQSKTITSGFKGDPSRRTFQDQKSTPYVTFGNLALALEAV